MSVKPYAYRSADGITFSLTPGASEITLAGAYSSLSMALAALGASLALSLAF